jgi:hypothetical protein
LQVGDALVRVVAGVLSARVGTRHERPIRVERQARLKREPHILQFRAIFRSAPVHKKHRHREYALRQPRQILKTTHAADGGYDLEAVTVRDGRRRRIRLLAGDPHGNRLFMFVALPFAGRLITHNSQTCSAIPALIPFRVD